MIAAAVEGADRISASPIPTGVSLALVYVQAHGLICICLEAGVTKAIEASHGVDALPVAADVGDFLTLVAIVALPGGGEAVAGLAVAAVAACGVDAFSVALAHGAVLTLIDIFTNQQLVVIEEAHGALTPEAANHVDAHPVFTDPWDLPALINIHGQASVYVNDEAWPLAPTQGSKFICAWDGALFTGLIPGPANVVGAAAHLLGHVEQELSVTGLVVSIIVSVAQASSHVHAVVSPVHLHVVWRADAGVVANGVVTRPWTADSGSLTLIHVITHTRVFIQVVASWTATLEAAEGVDALPTLAQPWKLLALIDVFQYNGDGVWTKTFSSRAKDFILRRVHSRTQLTRGSPGFTQRTTAGSLGNTNSDFIATGCVTIVSAGPDIQITVSRPSIDTANSSWVQLKIRRTVACVAARGVDTVPTDTGRWVQTLVNICAVPTTSVQFVANLALATEEAREIVTCPKDTDVGEGAFIDVFTGLPVGTGHKAHVAFTAVPARGVEALAVAAEVQVLGALVQVCAGKAIARVAVLTEAAVRPHGVLTVCVLAAHVGSIRALVQICALNAISNPPRAAAALEAPCCVGAHSMSATVVGSDLTFIDICTARFSFFP